MYPKLICFNNHWWTYWFITSISSYLYTYTLYIWLLIDEYMWNLHIWYLHSYTHILYLTVHLVYWYDAALLPYLDLYKYTFKLFCTIITPCWNRLTLIWTPGLITQEPVVHYNDFIMGTKASQITSLTIVYSTIYSVADHRKHQSSTSLAFVQGIHRGPVNSLHKWPVTRKMFPFDDIIMF